MCGPSDDERDWAVPRELWLWLAVFAVSWVVMLLLLAKSVRELFNL